VQHTLYAGYFLARKHVMCDAMKPAPPVTRIVLVMSALNQLHSLRGLLRPWSRSTVTTSVVLGVRRRASRQHVHGRAKDETRQKLVPILSMSRKPRNKNQDPYELGWPTALQILSYYTTLYIGRLRAPQLTKVIRKLSKKWG